MYYQLIYVFTIIIADFNETLTLDQYPKGVIGNVSVDDRNENASDLINISPDVQRDVLFDFLHNITNAMTDFFTSDDSIIEDYDQQGADYDFFNITGEINRDN